MNNPHKKKMCYKKNTSEETDGVQAGKDLNRLTFTIFIDEYQMRTGFES